MFRGVREEEKKKKKKKKNRKLGIGWGRLVHWIGAEDELYLFIFRGREDQ